MPGVFIGAVQMLRDGTSLVYSLESQSLQLCYATLYCKRTSGLKVSLRTSWEGIDSVSFKIQEDLKKKNEEMLGICSSWYVWVKVAEMLAAVCMVIQSSKLGWLTGVHGYSLTSWWEFLSADQTLAGIYDEMGHSRPKATFLSKRNVFLSILYMKAKMLSTSILNSLHE